MWRWLNWLSGKKDDVLVVIWGKHSADWMSALGPSSDVWASVPGVRKVLLMRPPAGRVPWWRRAGRRTVVIPLMEEHAVNLPAGGAVFAPSRRAVETLGDKARFARYAGEQGLSASCPRTYGSLEEAMFPCVIKRTDLNGSVGVEIADAREQAMAVASRSPFSGHACLIQEHVPFATEYVVHCVCRSGRVIWHIVYAHDGQRLLARDRNGKPPLRRAPLPPAVLARLEAFLTPLDYSGPCNADCTWDEAGRVVVFEINPRMGGTLMRPEHRADLASCLSVIVAEALTKAGRE